MLDTFLERTDPPGRNQLFIVRVWLDDDAIEWRGKARCVTSGQARDFNDWQSLIAGLQAMLPPIKTIKRAHKRKR
ncbi:MAG: hypothetical protein HZC40_22295 [Chloroflexi bacterium]|nr:hypothetical protein [Chloroflexota bacterium]